MTIPHFNFIAITVSLFTFSMVGAQRALAAAPSADAYRCKVSLVDDQHQRLKSMTVIAQVGTDAVVSSQTKEGQSNEILSSDEARLKIDSESNGEVSAF